LESTRRLTRHAPAHKRTPSERLRQLVEAHGWLHDPQQVEVAGALDNLFEECMQPRRPVAKTASYPWSLFTSLSGVAASDAATANRSTTVSSLRGGVYLHGPVGTGKTVLMDLLLKACHDSGVVARRLHFHEVRGMPWMDFRVSWRRAVVTQPLPPH